MEKKPSLISNALTFGALTAIIITLYSISVMSASIENRALGYISYVILIGGMAYGTVNFKKKTPGGFISYGQALGSCTLIVLFVAVICGIFTYVYMSIDTSVIEKIAQKAEEEMQKKDMPEDQMEKGVEMMRKMMKPHWMALFAFMGYLFFGFLLALIVSAFVKKDNPNPFNNTAEPA